MAGRLYKMKLSEIVNDKPIIVDIVKNLLKKGENVYTMAATKKGKKVTIDDIDIEEADEYSENSYVVIKTQYTPYGWEIPEQSDKLKLEKRDDGWELIDK